MFVFLYFAYKMDKRLTVLEIKEDLRNGKDNKLPFYKQKKFWAGILTLGAGVLTGAVTWYDAIAQAITAAFGN